MLLTKKSKKFQKKTPVSRLNQIKYSFTKRFLLIRNNLLLNIYKTSHEGVKAPYLQLNRPFEIFKNCMAWAQFRNFVQMKRKCRR